MDHAVNQSQIDKIQISYENIDNIKPWVSNIVKNDKLLKSES